jgi:hypothetical protein
MVVGVLGSSEGDFNMTFTFPKDVLAKTAEADWTGEVVLTAGAWNQEKA